MNIFSGRLPATSSPASPAAVSCWPWPCTGSSRHAVKWVRELNAYEYHHLFLYFLFIFLFYLFWVFFVFFPGDQVRHPAYCTTRMILQEGHRRSKLLARARNCIGQLKHPPAHRVPDHSFSPFGDPLPAMVIIYIFISMSATTNSLLNCPYFTPKQCECSMSAQRCCLTAVLTCFAQL